MTRNDVLNQAFNECMKELYKFSTPNVEWEDFVSQCETYSKQYEIWEDWKTERWNDWKTEDNSHPEWENKTLVECIGPRPYEFYYIPKEIMKDICDSYINSYRIESHDELSNTIQILKDYCKNPIVDKYIEGKLREDGTRCPGHRGYDHPDNLEKEINIILTKAVSCFGKNNPEWVEGPEYDTGTGIKLKPATEISSLSTELQDKFFEFLDMASNFYNWNRELNTFNTSIYLGSSPCTNKDTVIENWKKYRDTDIKIDEEQIKKEYYGDDYD